MAIKARAALVAVATAALALPAHADESVLGYVSGAETLPMGASDAYVTVTRRWDKGRGDYTAHDYSAEIEHGFTHRLTAGVELKGQGVDAGGLLVDGYLPGPEQYGFKASGIEGKLKFMFLSPAKDVLGLSATFSLQQNWLDPHSGRDKDTTKFELGLQAQKLLLDDQLALMLNTGVEGTYARRAPLDAATKVQADAGMQTLSGDPDATFEWPTEPEMELEFKLGAGAAYRFAPNWSAGVETLYETEFETEVGQERWSVFAGPALHYGGEKIWATLSYFRQLAGGGEAYIGQTDDLHLIEKTRHELRVKLGYNF